MPSTTKHPRLYLLHPTSVLLFVVLVAAWGVVWVLPEPTGRPVRVVARLCGYLGALAMLVPYVHVVRRFFRHRHLGESRAWLAWHVGAAYTAFFFVLVHARGRANGPLTLTLLILTWVVMVSGVVGYYGQKLLYALMPRMIRREYGLERIEHQRRRLLDRARVLVVDQHVGDWKPFAEQVQQSLERSLPEGSAREEVNASLKMLKRGEWEDTKKGVDHRAVVARALFQVHGGDFQRLGAEHPAVVAPTTGAVRTWCADALRDCFEQPFSFWRWLLGRPHRDALSRSYHANALEFATSDKRESLLQLWELVQERRELDLEYRLHHLGRLWLLFHGPAAWALLALMIEHVVSSVRYGGW